VIFASTLSLTEPLFTIADKLPVPDLIVTEWAIILIIGLFAYFATRKMERVPRGLQNAFEMIVQWTFDFFGQMLGESVAKKWAPLLSTFFLFILVCNYSGLLPGAAYIDGFKAPTSDWNITATLAIIVFFRIERNGILVHSDIDLFQ
jgi:F-type H+-transporting ATPase subunit a